MNAAEKGMKRSRIILVLGAAAIVIAGCVASAVCYRRHLHTYFTDDQSIRVQIDEAVPRIVLWQPPMALDQVINTHDDEYEPALSFDGQAMVFVRGRAGGNADLYVATRVVGPEPSYWSDPQPLSSINTQHDELGPALAPNGRTLYFYSDRPGPRGVGGYDIWVSHRDGDEWTEPLNAGPAVNSPFNEYGVAIAPDGSRLYITSNRPRDDANISHLADAWSATLRENLHTHDYDMYVATISNGVIDRVAPLEAVNSDANDGAPAVSPAGDFLYFCSDRAGGAGGFDLYRARMSDGAAGSPQNLGPQINTGQNEMDPALSMGGFALHFSSDRASAGPPDFDGSYDVYQSESREVFEQVDDAPINWAQIGHALLWPLLWLLLGLLALVLIPLLWKGVRSRKLSLLLRCLLASLLVHAVLMFLLTFWEVTSSIAGLLHRGGGTRIALAPTGSGDSVVAQIRGRFTHTLGHVVPFPSPERSLQAPMASPIESIVASLTVEQRTMNVSVPRTATVAIDDALPPSAGPIRTVMNVAPSAIEATPVGLVESAVQTGAPEPEAARMIAAVPDLSERDRVMNAIDVSNSGSIQPDIPIMATPIDTIPAGGALLRETKSASEAIVDFSEFRPGSPPAIELAQVELPVTMSAAPHGADIEPALNITIETGIASQRSAAGPDWMDASPSFMREPPTMEWQDSMPSTVTLARQPAVAAIESDPDMRAPVTKRAQEVASHIAEELAVALPSGTPDTIHAAPGAASGEPALAEVRVAAPMASLRAAAPPMQPLQTQSASVVLPPSVAGVGEVIDTGLRSSPDNLGLAALEATFPAAGSNNHSNAASAADALNLDIKLPSDVAEASNPYVQRSEDIRESLVQQMGGSEATEKAVSLALQWLAAHQSEDGRWAAAGFDDACGACGGAGRFDNDIAATGLALLCFLGADHTHAKDGPYQHHVKNGLNWLRSQLKDTGDLRGGETMYSHGIATIAMAEALGMTSDQSLHDVVAKAVEFIAGARHVAGGWRYEPGQMGDTSVLGWQVMALVSAKRAGIIVSDDALRSAERWMDRVSIRQRPGRYCYQPGQRFTPSMTAEGLFVLQLLGVGHGEQRMNNSIDYVLQNLPAWTDRPNTYYWYYATLALFQRQGEPWKMWNEAITRTLLEHQRTEGAAAGSWDPADNWSRIGGRVYQTALCTLCLEVYYRYLPMYASINIVASDESAHAP
jgi:hypothetical protein